jgi:glucose-1-phosphate thymidylyltransferase
MHVLIPAGGRGTRLRPLTHYSPKPLLPLGDRPILTRIVEGIPAEVPVTVLVTPEVETEFRAWAEGLRGPQRVQVYVEQPRPSGLKGPIVALAECVADLGIDDDVVVMMGDSVHPFSFGDFIGSGVNGCPRLAIYELPELSDACRFGVVEVGECGCVAGFEEKPARPRSPWIFTGYLYVPARLVARLAQVAETGVPQMGHLLVRYLEQQERIEVFRVSGEWHDIGTFASYLRAHAALSTAAEREGWRAGGNRLAGTVYVHPDARVSGSELRDCIILGDTRVVDSNLRGCVVYPGASVERRMVEGRLLVPGPDWPAIEEYSS